MIITCSDNENFLLTFILIRFVAANAVSPSDIKDNLRPLILQTRAVTFCNGSLQFNLTLKTDSAFSYFYCHLGKVQNFPFTRANGKRPSFTVSRLRMGNLLKKQPISLL